MLILLPIEVRISAALLLLFRNFSNCKCSVFCDLSVNHFAHVHMIPHIITAPFNDRLLLIRELFHKNISSSFILTHSNPLRSPKSPLPFPLLSLSLPVNARSDGERVESHAEQSHGQRTRQVRRVSKIIKN